MSTAVQAPFGIGLTRRSAELADQGGRRRRLLRLARREDENQDACGILATQRNPT